MILDSFFFLIWLGKKEEVKKRLKGAQPKYKGNTNAVLLEREKKKVRK